MTPVTPVMSYTSEYISDGSMIHLATVEDERDSEDRRTYAYLVTDHTGRTVMSGGDLRSGVGMDPPLTEMMGTLLSFLIHYGETSDDDIPQSVKDWCSEHSDELQMIALQYADDE